MKAIINRLSSAYKRLESTAARVLFRNMMPTLAEDKLSFIRLLRQIVGLSVPVAFIVLVFGIFTWSSKSVGAAGLLFDIIGVIRIFIDGEWERLLEEFKDEEAYPYGPPSYVTREMFADADPEALLLPNELEVVPEMHLYYYWQRGTVLLCLGFFFQLVGLLMG